MKNLVVRKSSIFLIQKQEIQHAQTQKEISFNIHNVPLCRKARQICS